MDRALYQVVYLWLDIQCAVHSVSHYDITEIMYKWSLKCAASLWLVVKWLWTSVCTCGLPTHASQESSCSRCSSRIV